MHIWRTDTSPEEHLCLLDHNSSHLKKLHNSGLASAPFPILSISRDAASWCTVFSPIGTKFAIAYADGSIEIFIVKTGASEFGRLPGHDDGIGMLLYSEDSQYLLSASEKSIIIWDADTGKTIWHLPGFGENYVSFYFPANMQQLHIAGPGETLTTIDILSGKEISKKKISDFVSPSPVLYDYMFAPDGKTICAWEDKIIGSNWLVYSENNQQLGLITPSILSSDNKEVVSLQNIHAWKQKRIAQLYEHNVQKYVKIWNSDKTFTHGDVPLLGPFLAYDLSCSLSFSPDGQFIALFCYNGFIRIYSVTEGKPLSDVLLVHTLGVCEVSFSPDNQLIITTSYDETVRMWSLHDLFNQ